MTRQTEDGGQGTAADSDFGGKLEIGSYQLAFSTGSCFVTHPSQTPLSPAELVFPRVK
jgi:hypothetical protein